MDDGVLTRWVRIGMVVVLAAPQLVTGVWAVLAPASWFESFPGFDPRLVAADPPYNQHLATDGGAGFLATGVALVLAAIWARRRPAVLAIVTYLAFAVPHALFHTANPSDALTGAEQALNVGLQWSGIAFAVVMAITTMRPAPSDSRVAATAAATLSR